MGEKINALTRPIECEDESGSVKGDEKGGEGGSEKCSDKGSASVSGVDSVSGKGSESATASASTSCRDSFRGSGKGSVGDSNYSDMAEGEEEESTFNDDDIREIKQSLIEFNNKNKTNMNHSTPKHHPNRKAKIGK